MRATEVFTPGQMPTITFVRDHLERREQTFKDAREQHLLVTISGPSKSGKTVFVRNVVGADNLVSITGAGVQTPEQLWLKVFHQIGTTIPSTSSAESNNSTSGTVATKGQLGLFGTGVDVSGNVARTSGSKAVDTITPVGFDHLQLLIKELAGTGLVVFIDDFHYIPRDVQKHVAEHIKEAIDKGVDIVCASVPYHSEDLLRANPDLQGRFVAIDFDYWDAKTLTQIAERGFEELGLKVERDLMSAFAGEAAGSPQLMQSICLNACFELDTRETRQPPLDVPLDKKFIRNVCNRTSSTDFSSTIEKLREGPKTRGTERLSYRLSDGETGDVYTIVLRALSLDPPQLRFTYSQLLSRIAGVCEKQTPSGSSTSGACLHVAQLANDGQPKVLLEWDSENEILDIRDPYLLFYMRWSDTIVKLN
ncbi:hypothetical protein [Burkholderia pseudomallei]|uniref:hypothetical protein n=1 Tax=Burkholderia pseudomallei TaxID=28450 RepID=UPI0005364BC6|nr:hypothetical protein [Burkholderia pseudomallei]KGV60352.1 archaeal ATPase family protein [Burkholderia pseudomallei ABCPW 91]